MDLPVSVDDPSLLQHEPLRSQITVSMCVGGQRSLAKDSVSRFVEAMQRNGQAAAAAKKWAWLVFQDVFSNESSFEVTDGGKELYRIFFEYQNRLYQAQRDGDFDKAHQYHAHVRRSGISIIKAVRLRDDSTNTQHSTRGRGSNGGSRGKGNQRSSHQAGPEGACCQAGTAIYHPDAGLARFPAIAAAYSDFTPIGNSATSPTLWHGSRSITGSPATQQGSAFDAPVTIGALSTLPKAVKPSKRLAPKKEKKRKASSQRPPVIAPSDVSEDDKELPEIHAVPAANSLSHRSKRITSNLSHQPNDLLEAKNRVDGPDTAHRTETNAQHRKATTRVSHPESSLTSFPSGGIVSRSSIKSRRSAVFPLSFRKHSRGRVSDVATQPTRQSLNSRKPWKIKLTREFQIHTSKRVRRASMSPLDNERGGPGSTCSFGTKCLQEPKTQGSLASASSPTRESNHGESKAQRKRTRLEFETALVASGEDASTTIGESLGPDVRSFRPLPRKVRDIRLLPAIHGTPCGVSSIEHADQLLRDIASNALATLQEGVGEDTVEDWTQDNEHDAECDDFGGNDEDEASEIQIITAASLPPKPPVPAPPRIWAQSRQEICESLEYFRCYHGGVYSKDDIVKGYLLGAYAANRDIFHHDGKFIISHGGGKSESILDTRRGPRRYQTDQDQEASDKSVRALLKTWKDRRPIVLLADDKYAPFPYDLTSANYTYVVLGLYWISHAWAECQSTRDGSGRIVRWKFAFQWCEGQGDPWWQPQRETTDTAASPPKSILNSGTCPAEGSSHPTNIDEGHPIQCENCQKHSPFVYKQGWMCLNPGCGLFWSINGEEPEQLDYREEFLNMLPQKFDRLPNITPAKIVETPGGITTTYAFSKGWHCTNCGRLSCRYKWECWECSNCEFRHVVNGRIGKDSGILACRLEPIDLGTHGGFTNRLTFILPHDRGKIHLILGTPSSNGDANDIFQLYQQQASTGELRLRRYPLRNHAEHYLPITFLRIYVGGSGQTVPFHEAPDCIQRALALIKERARLALSVDVPFNEVLSAAYMERQKMSFHSDSEKGLGPTVASLSLGSAALMHFRPHVIMENLKAKSAHALTLVLRHGDVLVMDGDGVQRYYEHTVVPMNFRIAATARCIGTA